MQAALVVIVSARTVVSIGNLGRTNIRPSDTFRKMQTGMNANSVPMNRECRAANSSLSHLIVASALAKPPNVATAAAIPHPMVARLPLDVTGL